jgi:hypothetical protein
MKRRCCYCGFNSSEATMKLGNSGWQCRSISACYKRLKIKTTAMKHVGRQMANVCFNVGQHLTHHQTHVVDKSELEIMLNLSRQWDSI